MSEKILLLIINRKKERKSSDKKYSDIKLTYVLYVIFQEKIANSLIQFQIKNKRFSFINKILKVYGSSNVI